MPDSVRDECDAVGMVRAFRARGDRESGALTDPERRTG